jgi:hypothetical protein
LGEAGTTGVPNRQGFDYFFGYLNQRHAHNYYPTFLWRNEERVKLRNVVPDEDEEGSGNSTNRVDYTHDLIAEESLRFIEGNRGGPFFLYLAFTIPHANNEAKNKGMEVPDLGEFANKDWPDQEKAKAAMITRMDRDVGRLMACSKNSALTTTRSSSSPATTARTAKAAPTRISSTATGLCGESNATCTKAASASR